MLCDPSANLRAGVEGWVMSYLTSWSTVVGFATEDTFSNFTCGASFRFPISFIFSANPPGLQPRTVLQ